MYGLAVLRLARSARLTSFTDSVLSSPLLSWNGSWTWTDRKGGRARRRASGGQAFGPTTVVTTHTEDGADIAVSLAPSARRSAAELRVELGCDRERDLATVFGLPAFGIMDGVVEFQIGW